MPLIFENFGGKHKGTPNLKILRSRHIKDSRTLWRLTRTQRTRLKNFKEHKNIKRISNLKFLENQI